MKLCAKVKARKGGREAVKTDDTALQIELTYKNRTKYGILYTEQSMRVTDHKGNIILESVNEPLKPF